MATCACCHQAIPQDCNRCPEQIVFKDGKPMSYQNHFKVCRPEGKKNVYVSGPLVADLTPTFGPQRARDLAKKHPSKTAEEIVLLELKS